MSKLLSAALEKIADGTWSLRFPSDMGKFSEVSFSDFENWEERLSTKLRLQLGCTDDHPNRVKTWTDIIYPEDLVSAHKQMLDHIESEGEKPYEVLVRYKTYNNLHIKVLCTGKAVFIDGLPVTMEGMHILKHSQKDPIKFI